ncbi:MAG: FecR family protein [Bacteroidales bacterium]|nr:FecR family protein [Bacteroidales bacterium]
MLKHYENIEIEELITRFLDHETSPEEIAIIQDLLEQNPDAQKIFTNVYKTQYTIELDKITSKVDPDAAFEKFLKTTKQEKPAHTTEPKQNKTRKIIRLAMRVAAVLMLAIGIWFTYSTISNKEKLVQVESYDQKDMKITLSDNSEVYLNKNSQLNYPEEFKNKSKRRVSLIGEAFFNIQSIKNNQFIVTAGPCEIVAIGTSFNVMTYPGENNIIISVKEGSVSVKATLSDGSAIFDTVTSGNQTTYLINEEKFVKNNIINENYLAWKTGIITFANTRLEDVFQLLENVFDVKAKVNNKQINDCLFTGKFDHQTIEQIFQILELAFDIQVVKNENKFEINGTGC